MKKINESWQLRLGVILSYANEAVDILSGLIYTPIMLSLLGQNEYGLYQLVFSVVSYLRLIGLGFSSSYQRYYAKAKLEDEFAVARLNSMFLIVFSIMSLLCLVCGAIMTANAEMVFGSKLTAAEIDTARTLLIFAVFSMALTFPNSLFTSFITANKRFVFLRIILLLQHLLNPCICVPLLLLGYGSVGLVVVSTVLTIVAFIANIYFCSAKLKIQFSFVHLQWSKLKEIWGFTFFIFLNQIVNQINWNLGKLLLGHMYGTATVAIYSIGGQLRNYYSMFSSSVSNVFIPKVNEIVSKTDDNHELNRLFTNVGRIQTLIMLLIFSGFTFFGKTFISLWAGPGYETSYYIALMLMAVLLIPYIQNLGVEIQRAKNKHRARSIIYLAMSAINVALSIPLIKQYGAIGAAIGTVIAVFLCNIVFMNIYYAVYIKLDIKGFWKRIARLLVGLPIPTVIAIFLNYIVPQVSWMSLLLKIGIYTIVYVVSMYFLGNNPNDRAFLKSACLGFVRKNKK